MRNYVANFLVACLMIIMVHSAAGGNHTPVHIDDVQAGQQADQISVVDDRKAPSEESAALSECAVCHVAHVILLIEPQKTDLVLFSTQEFNIASTGAFPTATEDITNPPILFV